jgi:hypothetical protein
VRVACHRFSAIGVRPGAWVLRPHRCARKRRLRCAAPPQSKTLARSTHRARSARFWTARGLPPLSVRRKYVRAASVRRPHRCARKRWLRCAAPPQSKTLTRSTYRARSARSWTAAVLCRFFAEDGLAAERRKWRRTDGRQSLPCASCGTWLPGRKRQRTAALQDAGATAPHPMPSDRRRPHTRVGFSRPPRERRRRHSRTSSAYGFFGAFAAVPVPSRSN